MIAGTHAVSQCPNCGGTDFEESNGRLVCKDCGKVIEDRGVSSDQTRVYSGYEEAIQKSTHSFAHDVPRNETQEKNNMIANGEIGSLCNELHIPKFVAEEAMDIYKRYSEEKRIRSDKIPAIASAIVYLVCKRSNIHANIKHIVDHAGITKSDLMSEYMNVRMELKIGVSTTKFKRVVHYFMKISDISHKERSLAMEITDEVIKANATHGRSLNGFAGAIIYLAKRWHGNDIDYSDAANIAEVSEITIRNRVKDIKKLLHNSDFEIPPSVQLKFGYGNI